MSPGSPVPPPRRLAAFALDAALLGAAGLALVRGGFGSIAPLGDAGPLVGAVLVMAYVLATFQPLTGLRSAGQRLLGLVHVPARGPWSSSGRVFVAPLLLVMPLFLLRLWDVRALSDLAANPWRWAAVTLGISVLLANGLLVASPRGGRRLLHDRLAGTRIMLASASAPLPPDRLAAWQWGVIAGLPAVVLAVLGLAVPLPGTLEADPEIVDRKSVV